MQPLKTASPGRVSALRKTEQQQQQRVQQPQSPVVAPVKWSNVEVCVCVCVCFGWAGALKMKSECSA
jgi:hypothetical protein